ncbi:hypothetical protein WMY93_002613 [Mugilogobius chulae]|uniref:Uncharacterized protein n=1 Tax=Mugilogobius chulae TaxID=88201 RepID=A0AAW0PXM8_9GOBI
MRRNSYTREIERVPSARSIVRSQRVEAAQRLHVETGQLVEVTVNKQLMMLYILFYMDGCRSLHLWPPAERLCDDETSGLDLRGEALCFRAFEASQVATGSKTFKSSSVHLNTVPEPLQAVRCPFSRCLQVWSGVGPGLHMELRVKHGAMQDQLSLCCPCSEPCLLQRPAEHSATSPW